MAVSASTLKPVFNIGEFSVTTSLTIPSDDLSDALSFSLPSPIYPQLPNLEYSTTPVVPSVWTLARLTYNGTEVFKNAQFDSPPAAAPTAPQSIISVSGVDGVDELYQDANPIPLVKDSNGNVASGTYVLTLIYIYQDDNLVWYADTIVYPAISYAFTEQKPSLDQWYDTGLPKLSLLDNAVYQLNGTTPTRNVEFILYPPQNRAEVTTTTTNIQEVSYDSFWTGGNEFQYTVLLTYSLSDKNIVNLQRAYKAFTVYNVSRCDIFNCLNDLYTRFTDSNCGTKQKAILQQDIIEATNLSVQILTGSGCGEDTFSATLDAFNALCGSTCECSSTEPTQLNAANVVPLTSIQTVASTTATTEVDLSAGSTVFVQMSAAGGTTEISATNITQYAEYRFIFTRESGTQDATFDAAIFFDGDGAVATVTPLTTNKVILTFFATTSTTLTMQSRND